MADNSIWIHYVDETGNSDDYSVTDWDFARQDAVRHLTHDVGYVTDDAIAQKIKELLQTDKWGEAVELFNDHNAMKMQMLLREGKRPFDNPYPPPQEERAVGYGRYHRQ